MISGLYAASTNLDAVIRQQDTIAYNIANAGVSGHKGKQVVFRSFPQIEFASRSPFTQPGFDDNQAIGRVGTGVGVDWAYMNFEPGPLVETGVATDLTVDGEGMFAVSTPAGERYTRSSQFKLQIDPEGGQATLTTPDGYPLVGESGPIKVPVDRDFNIDLSGNVSVDGQPINKIRVVEVADRNVLLPESASLFKVEDQWNDDVKPATESVVRQGWMEKSNVNTIVEMTRMIESFRNYESAAKVISVLDRTLELAAGSIARTA